MWVDPTQRMTGDIGLNSVVRANIRQLSVEIDGETVLLNFDDGFYYSINSVGARIWTLVQDATRVCDVKAALLSEFDVDSARCEADLLALLADLEAKNLIEVLDADPA